MEVGERILGLRDAPAQRLDPCDGLVQRAEERVATLVQLAQQASREHAQSSGLRRAHQVRARARRQRLERETQGVPVARRARRCEALGGADVEDAADGTAEAFAQHTVGERARIRTLGVGQAIRLVEDDDEVGHLSGRSGDQLQLLGGDRRIGAEHDHGGVQVGKKGASGLRARGEDGAEAGGVDEAHPGGEQPMGNEDLDTGDAPLVPRVPILGHVVGKPVDGDVFPVPVDVAHARPPRRSVSDDGHDRGDGHDAGRQDGVADQGVQKGRLPRA